MNVISRGALCNNSLLVEILEISDILAEDRYMSQHVSSNGANTSNYKIIN